MCPDVIFAIGKGEYITKWTSSVLQKWLLLATRQCRYALCQFCFAVILYDSQALNEALVLADVQSGPFSETSCLLICSHCSGEANGFL